MYRVLSIAGTRPELIRLSRCFAVFDTVFEHKLCFSGQNYSDSLSKQFFEDLAIRKPDYLCSALDKSFGYFLAELFDCVDRIALEFKPHAVVILGDTNTSLAAIQCRRHGIPVIHVEAGNRSFSWVVPEESNRKIVDAISFMNVAYSQQARQYLIAEGKRGDDVVVLGSPLLEVLNHYKPKIDSSRILAELSLMSKKYFLLSLHRAELVESVGFQEFFWGLMRTLLDEYGMKIVISLHPHTKAKLFESNHLPSIVDERILFCKPFKYSDYIALQINAYCVVSDSGSLTEEASMLNLDAVNVRSEHERPEGEASGVVIQGGLKPNQVMNAIKLTKKFPHSKAINNRAVAEYQVSDFSRRLCALIVNSIVRFGAIND